MATISSLTQNEAFKRVIKYFMIVVGSAIYAVGFQFFMYPNNIQSLNRADIDNDATGGNVKTDGSTEMTNGQGRDSLKIGNLSHQAKSDSQRGSKSSRANT